MNDGGVWFIGTMVGLIGWLSWWIERGQRRRVEREQAEALKKQAVALMDAFHLGRIEGRATPAQRDAALRQLWEGTSS